MPVPKALKESGPGCIGLSPFRNQIDRIISQHDVETREGKLTASTELVTLLAQLTSAVEQDEYTRYAAERLGVSNHH